VTRSFQPCKIRRGFTLLELLVVMGIMVIMMAVMIPAMKSMLQSNGEAQSVNVIRSYLATARSIAISQHRQAGVVFFEETGANTSTSSKGQTALQLVVENTDQSQVNHVAHPENTVFIYYSNERQYLPPGMRVATMNDSSLALTGDETTSGGAAAPHARLILFNANGQMILRNGTCRPLTTGPQTNDYPKAYADWNLPSPNGTASDGISSPGVLVFNINTYRDFVASDSNNGAQLVTDKGNWLKQHAAVIIVNAYTGGVIR
jgi:prepilin-type N-terminal cleavage/methylation domain-containing protein